MIQLDYNTVMLIAVFFVIALLFLGLWIESRKRLNDDPEEFDQLPARRHRISPFCYKLANLGLVSSAPICSCGYMDLNQALDQIPAGGNVHTDQQPNQHQGDWNSQLPYQGPGNANMLEWPDEEQESVNTLVEHWLDQV